MKTVLFTGLLFVVLATVSLSLKIQRYAVEVSTPKNVLLEQQLLEVTQENGWEVKLKVPLNTNQASFVYVLQSSSCPKDVLVSILGKDASDKYQLSQYMGSDEVVFLINGNKVDYLFSPLLYAMTAVTNVLRMFSTKIQLPLPLSVYGPIDTEACRLY
ncbi:hypothetical protein [Vibrio mediterranei]|uniref:Uncharacterized protein n=1 Tax=Vibrio mediterranei TaxID=689 RepID=A0ABX5DGT0_9VIBR|nr:hypothetical protein [Vibrio mediterranei]PCD89265.1 hypothetical protein COR52_04855 [Vibrio mediterranei]PRQ68373.1 hypothetical protein COR51_07970 [Vibrio mediterranei]PTC05453.1 hypothetical protein C9980_09440 [Vibrio mediterranei]SBO10904.1 hypothetical protein VME0621_03039 [Vibrio mediterranei]